MLPFVQKEQVEGEQQQPGQYREQGQADAVSDQAQQKAERRKKQLHGSSVVAGWWFAPSSCWSPEPRRPLACSSQAVAERRKSSSTSLKRLAFYICGLWAAAAMTS